MRPIYIYLNVGLCRSLHRLQAQRMDSMRLFSLNVDRIQFYQVSIIVIIMVLALTCLSNRIQKQLSCGILSCMHECMYVCMYDVCVCVCERGRCISICVTVYVCMYVCMQCEGQRDGEYYACKIALIHRYAERNKEKLLLLLFV